MMTTNDSSQLSFASSSFFVIGWECLAICITPSTVNYTFDDKYLIQLDSPPKP